MSDKPNDGGPAFPVHPDAPHKSDEGMSLRDWFAGQVLAAVVTVTSKGQHNPGNGPTDTRSIYERMASDAYRLADAMIAERAGGGGQ